MTNPVFLRQFMLVETMRLLFSCTTIITILLPVSNIKVY